MGNADMDCTILHHPTISGAQPPRVRAVAPEQVRLASGPPELRRALAMAEALAQATSSGVAWEIAHCIRQHLFAVRVPVEGARS